MPKSRRSSSSRSRTKSTKSTKPFKLGISYEALRTFLARSLEPDDIDPAVRAALAVASEHDDIDYGPALSAAVRRGGPGGTEAGKPGGPYAIM